MGWDKTAVFAQHADRQIRRQNPPFNFLIAGECMIAFASFPLLCVARFKRGHFGHQRTIMEMPQTGSTSTKRQVWNAGRAVGAKRALKPK